MISNPFPRLAIPRNNRIIFDPDGNVKRILTYAERVFKEKINGAGVIIGSYGFGKTHLLKYLEYIFSSQEGILALYISNPCDSIVAIYKELVVKVLKHLIEVKEYLPPMMSKALDLLANSDHYYDALQWLCGERISSRIRHKLGLVKNIDSYMAVEYMCSIFKALDKKYNGYVILIDEFETILELNRTKRISYLNALRRFVDSVPCKTLILVASTPAGWDEVINTHMALARRLSSLIIYLRNLKKEEISEFLEMYLKNYGSNLSSVHEIFDDRVIDLLHDITNGNPGEVLKYASILVDEILLKNECKIIKVEEAKEVLSRYI